MRKTDLRNEIEYGIQFLPVCFQRHHNAAAHHVERLLEVAHDQQLRCLASYIEEIDMTIKAAKKSSNNQDEMTKEMHRRTTPC
jgi:hypothetical protein